MKDISHLTKLKVMSSTHSCTVNVCEKIFTVGESQLIVLMPCGELQTAEGRQQDTRFCETLNTALSTMSS